MEKLPSKTFLVFRDVFKTSSRRLQRNSFHHPKPWRRFRKTCCKYVLKTYLKYVLLKAFQDVFKTSSRRVCKTSCNYVFKTSTRRLRDVLEDKKMLHWRRLEDDFKTSLVRLRQDKSLLSRRLICSSRSWKLSQSEFLSKDADSFLEFFFFRVLFHIFTVAN